jgi:hypothetical protein
VIGAIGGIGDFMSELKAADKVKSAPPTPAPLFNR